MSSSLRRALAAAVLPLLLAAPSLPAEAATADDRLRSLGDEFVGRRLARAPHEATRLGVHATDHLLLPVTRVTLAEDRTWLRDLRARLALLRRDELSSERAIEYDLLAALAEREGLELDVIRPFERDPGAYSPLVAGSIETVMERSVAAPCERLRLAARRLSQVPEVLRAARINLGNPPRALTENAIDEFAVVLRFYREAVPALAAGCREARLQADLAQADTTAVRAVEEFLVYLREDLLPASRGELAIGPDACRRLLRTGLLEEVAAVDTLLAQGERALEERRAELTALAPSVAGGGRGALDSLAVEWPEAGGLAPYLERQLGRVREFLRRRALVTLPARETLSVRDARPFPSAHGLTTLHAPGPWETRALDAWLEVAPPDSSADAARRRALLARFDPWNSQLAVMSEGLPGRYLRGVALRAIPSRLRQALQSAWPAEDWGQYCEQMMVEEGYGEGDPRYRLAAAARALRYAGRSLAALALHAGVMSPEEVRRMLEEKCLLDPDEAARETRQVAADPALMVYTLGARHLLELRDEARRMLGSRFRITVFNDAVLRYGASPPGIVQAGVRRELGVADLDTPVGARP